MCWKYCQLSVDDGRSGSVFICLLMCMCMSPLPCGSSAACVAAVYAYAARLHGPLPGHCSVQGSTSLGPQRCTSMIVGGDLEPPHTHVPHHDALPRVYRRRGDPSPASLDQPHQQPHAPCPRLSLCPGLPHQHSQNCATQS